MADAKSGVISHWHKLVDSFSTSGLDFYGEVENAVDARMLPEAKFSRVNFKEGGFGSAGREYLRIERKGVAFDVCAAPYGNSFFFSWWLTRLGPKHPFLYIVGFFVLAIFLPMLLAQPFKDSYSYLLVLPVMFVLTLIGLAVLTRRGVFGSEDTIVQVPVLGWLYTKLFNPSTYYSLDTALMFQESIRRAVNEVIDRTFKEQGLRALSEAELQPTIRDLAQ